MIPKQPRLTDPAYLDFIRGKECLCQNGYCTGEIAPHHTISRAAWGSDHRAVPICAKHHGEVHRQGMAFLEDKYRFSALDEIIKLLSEYLKKIQ